jgi:multiple sugar transport system substrate-binding protein
MRLGRVLTLVVALVALAIAGCGGDDNEGGTASKNAKKAPAASENASGNIAWCLGKDTSGAYHTAIKNFKKKNPNITVKLVELPESADEQRTQLIQRLRAKSSECDVLGMDVIWTAEFAAQGWLQDAGSLVEKNKDSFIPTTLETAKYQDKYWAVPYDTNAGFIYYRTDQVKAPKSWEEIYKQAAAKNGLVYQGAAYEGLTVNFCELLFSAGGKVLSDDGKKPEVDSDQGREVLTFMANGVKNGAVPKAVTTYQEQDALRAFQTGKATYERNWPYAYALNKEDPRVKDKFDIAPFPKFGSGEPASVLGGHNNAISAYSKNPKAAAAFIDFLVDPEVQAQNFIDTSTPPVVASAYDDPAVKKANAFAPDLKKAIEQGQVRPVTPVNPQVSEAIYKNVHDALQGKQAPDAALKKMSSDIEKALQTF